MSSELKLLKQRITELEAEKVEIKCKIAETLRMTEEERTRRVAENAKLKTRIKKSESEFRDRLTKVEQNQSLNELRGASHNSSNNSSSSFNSVTDQVST